MLLAAAALGACLLVLALAVPGLLARAAWPQRAPAYALLLWQALGLVAGLLAVEIALTVALAPAGTTHLSALGALSTAALPWWSYVAALAGLGLLTRLLWVLITSTVRTVHARRCNRVLVDLVATRNPCSPRHGSWTTTRRWRTACPVCGRGWCCRAASSTC